MRVFSKKQIEEVQDTFKIIDSVEKGFVMYSKGETNIPLPAHLYLENPPGEVHIKYGSSNLAEFYVIKIVSGFYQNPTLGLPSRNGLMLLFAKNTGELKAILHDEGLLTNLRTAAAGAIVARYLAPSKIKSIGIVGTGIQGRLQLQFLESIVECRDVIVWGRSEAKLKDYVEDPNLREFKIVPTTSIEYLAKHCNLIVTATPSISPLLFSHHIQKGTHITAVGSDDPGKQELDPLIFKRATRIIADSKEQCYKLGEIQHALREGVLEGKEIHELGEIIEDSEWRRSNDDQITVADLTGIAVQDLQIATLSYKRLITLKL